MPADYDICSNNMIFMCNNLNHGNYQSVHGSYHTLFLPHQICFAWSEICILHSKDLARYPSSSLLDGLFSAWT